MWTEDYKNRWQSSISFPPIAESLKDAFPQNWLRLHYFKGSQRLPKDKEDVLHIFKNVNDVFDLINAKSVIIITTDWSGIYEGSTFWDTTSVDSFGNKALRKLYITKRDWHNGVLDDLIFDVASAKRAGVIIADESFQWLMHPYDGGMDIIVFNNRLYKKLSSKKELLGLVAHL